MMDTNRIWELEKAVIAATQAANHDVFEEIRKADFSELQSDSLGALKKS
jgi:hypothetical protein